MSFLQRDTHAEAEYKTVQDELQIKTPGPHKLYNLSDTRWCCRAYAVLYVTIISSQFVQY